VCVHWQVSSVSESLEFEIFRQHGQLVNKTYNRTCRRLVSILRRSDSQRNDVLQNKDNISRLLTELRSEPGLTQKAQTVTSTKSTVDWSDGCCYTNIIIFPLLIYIVGQTFHLCIFTITLSFSLISLGTYVDCWCLFLLNLICWHNYFFCKVTFYCTCVSFYFINNRGPQFSSIQNVVFNLFIKFLSLTKDKFIV